MSSPPHAVRRARDRAAGEPGGEPDHHTAPEAHAAPPGLVPHPGGQLVLGLGGLTSCDSTGITFLTITRNHASAPRASRTVGR
ncbi:MULTISPECIES: hypothetical protein [Streptomyces]|uniref:hypothetical protein n=1 Tax=Streptomyces TaxID=1883 RepID=UPI00131C5E45|nr:MULTISPECIES: hypothetical protein [unclassified Streptomyces]